MSEITNTRVGRGRGRFWIGVVGVIFALQMSIGGVLLYYSHSDPSFAVEQDYYEKALNWDDDAAARRASEALGWTVDLRVEEATGVLRENSVVLRLSGPEGAPVAGAAVALVAHHNARAGDLQEIEMIEGDPGEYVGTMLARLPGVWIFNVRATSGEARFIHELRQDVSIASGPAS